VAKEYRSSEFVYEISEKGQDIHPLRIPAYNVISTVQGCATETVAEWKHPETGEWTVIRQSVRSVLYHNAEGFLEYIDVQFDQEYYLKDLADTFKSADTPIGTTPDSVTIELRYRSNDITDPTKEKLDKFTITIVSSQEDLSVYCSYEGLSLVAGEAMAAGEGLEYIITDSVKGETGLRTEFDLTTEVAGWD
jgi:hypothetical protein